MSLIAETVEDQEDSNVEDGQNLNDEEVENDTDSSHDDDATEPVDTNDNESYIVSHVELENHEVEVIADDKEGSELETGFRQEKNLGFRMIYFGYI